ncbi:hypothetical protein BX600DRAFT_470293 [Xylariales sp. PMI_506]|nr:hypothetical protein BX600DRAFT_470293 [Xylariales sp. PMI_506]
MPTPHVIVSIVQTIFYVPIVPLVFYVVIRNWAARPRMPWLPMVLFSLIRLVGGPVVIAQSYDQTNVGLIAAALVLLNVGAVPLIICMTGLARLLLGTPSSERTSKAHKVVFFTRRWIAVAVCHLAVGGGLGGNPTTALTGRGFTIAGYVMLAAAIVFLMWILVDLQRAARENNAVLDTFYLYGAWTSMPFLMVRSVYGIIYAIDAVNIESMWNPLFGNSEVFAIMALLPEYIVLCIFICMGFHRMTTGPASRASTEPQLECLDIESNIKTEP